MKNERNAGRKAVIDIETIDVIRHRIEAGERISFIAKEYGISRQALYKRLKNVEPEITRVDYIVNGNITTCIEVDSNNEEIHVINYASKLSQTAFGANENPGWEDFIKLLEKVYVNSSKDNIRQFICQNYKEEKISLELVEKCSSDSDIKIKCAKENGKIPEFTFDKTNIIYARSNTDGYQLKAVSGDKRYFIKSQAIIAGVPMRDWMVEIIASDLCEYLGIPCVKQRECEIAYAGRRLKGVYSDNFELDGYTFVSFERLLERNGLSSKDDEFIRMDSLNKMKWCAKKLSETGNLNEEDTFKYMLDMALIDCLVGNIDRHTRNFGLFFNQQTSKYEIPLIFDNGMGLFENDNYRDNYKDFDSAMNNVYVAPYGEDPFELLKELDDKYDLRKLYPGIEKWDYKGPSVSKFADEYLLRIKKILRK